jgi:hypothetical protein
MSNENITLTQMSISAATNGRIAKLERELEKSRAPRGVSLVKGPDGRTIGLQVGTPQPVSGSVPPTQGPEVSP